MNKFVELPLPDRGADLSFFLKKGKGLRIDRNMWAENVPQVSMGGQAEADYPHWHQRNLRYT